MSKRIQRTGDLPVSPFERIKRTNDAGMEFWSSREFAVVLDYGDYRNFEGVTDKAKLACFNSGHRLEDHFVDVTDMIEIGKGGQRSVRTVLMSRYACYLAIQNADPRKEIVAQGQTYFAVQTRRQELDDERNADFCCAKKFDAITSNWRTRPRGQALSSRSTTLFFRTTATWDSMVG